MKILITGSRGFIASTIGRTAANQGHQVLGISRAAQPAAGWPGEYASRDIVTADVSDLIRRFEPDAVFHAAGTASVSASFAAPLDDLRASLLSWANLLDCVRRSEIHPLILFPSSGAVYGQLKSLPVSENTELNPISPYGFHKAACESLAREYASCFDQRVIVARLFSVFGERQRRLLVWEIFQQLAGDNNEVWLQGTGEETRDYLHADDMAAAMLSLCESQAAFPKGTCSVVNVASGVETRVLDLANQLAGLMGVRKELRCRGIHRTGDPERWQADISLLRKLIPGWTAQPLESGLKKCLESWRGLR